MTEPGPLGDDDNPLEGLPFFGDLARLMNQGGGPISWDIARQVAAATAAGGQSEGNVDPSARMGLEQVARVAELRVADVTGLTLAAGTLDVAAVNRTEWAQRTLDAHTALLERLATGLDDARQRMAPEEGVADPAEAMLGGLFKMIGPVLLGMQSGFMVGHLASRTLGQYDLPLPRQGDRVMICLPNVDAFAEEWSLPVDEVRLWVCVHELAHHAVLRRPHVRARIEELVSDYVSGFEVDTGALEGRLAGVDPTDPHALQQALGDPEAILGAIRSDRQAAMLPQLEAVTAAVVGYVDWVLDTVGPSLIGSYGQLTEALRRRRVEAGPADRFVERLIGLELGQAHYQRAEAFVTGVVEREGADALATLWEAPHTLPTPAEIEAPGLWLARIELGDPDGGADGGSGGGGGEPGDDPGDDAASG